VPHAACASTICALSRVTLFCNAMLGLMENDDVLSPIEHLPALSHETSFDEVIIRKKRPRAMTRGTCSLFKLNQRTYSTSNRLHHIGADTEAGIGAAAALPHIAAVHRIVAVARGHVGASHAARYDYPSRTRRGSRG
jgi:hypothetical protein